MTANFGFKSAPTAAMLVLCLTAFAIGCSKPSSAPEAAASVTVPPTVARPGITFRANPNPVISADRSGLAQTSILWGANVARVQVRVDSPKGNLFSAGGPQGVVPTGIWVRNGMHFYLQDATAPDPTASSATLAMLTVVVQ